MTILVIYSEEPAFPATDQNPSAKRKKLGDVWVDYTGTEPTASDLQDMLTPDVGAMDQATLNAALSAEGSVVRALALVLLQEINTIRQKLPTPLPAYTTNQLIAALRSKMR